MGLSSSSTGTKLLNTNSFFNNKDCDYTVVFSGNPNVGKSTIFNNLTGLHQHTRKLATVKLLVMQVV